MSLPLRPSSLVRHSLTIAVAVLIVAAFVSGRRTMAQCGPNPIVCENQLTGTVQSTWDVSGAGDGSLQGFTTAISVNVGETVTFKIDTTAATYNMDIYRMGYYGGRGARKIGSTITGIGGQDQPNCVSNGSTGLRRLRQLGRIGVVGGPDDVGVGHLLRQAPASGHRWRESRLLRRSRRRGSLRRAVPDVGYDLAGIQPVRRQQLLRRIAGRPRVQGELQPSVHDAWNESGRLGIQRRVSDGPVD